MQVAIPVKVAIEQEADGQYAIKRQLDGTILRRHQDVTPLVILSEVLGYTITSLLGQKYTHGLRAHENN